MWKVQRKKQILNIQEKNQEKDKKIKKISQTNNHNNIECRQDMEKIKINQMKLSSKKT